MDLAERLDRYIASKSRKPDPFASDTDAMRDQLTSGGMSEDQAFDLALAMARERERARDVPEENILGGDMSRLFQQDPTMMERIKRLPAQTLGAGEALASLGSAAALSVPSMVQSLVTGEKDPLGMMKRQMYVPKTEEGMGALTAVGELLPEIPAMPQVQLQALQAIPAGAAAAQAQRGVQSGLKAAQPMLAEGAERILGAQGLMMQAAPSTVARMEAPTSPLGFYDPVHQAALNIQRKQGPGQAFLNELQRSENVNKEFLESSGIAEKLRNSPSITREEVQELAKGAVPEIQEVVKGAKGYNEAKVIAAQDIAETIQAGLGHFDDDYQALLNRWRSSPQGSAEERQAASTLEALLRQAGDVRGVDEYIDAGGAQTVNTKYGQYQLPGGKNYREVLLKMPSSKSETTNDIAKRLFNKEMRFLSENEKDQVVQESRRLFETQPKEFRSPHWEEPNVVAHIRMNDRTDADGKKVLFIEEIQSDWAQQGRKKGFQTNDLKIDGKTAEEWQNEAVRLFESMPDVPSPEQTSAMNAASRNARELRDRARSQGLKDGQQVPVAPFVQNTKEWLDLSLKNIIKRAVDEGYDRVAFINGTQSADRYDLSKQVERIDVYLRPAGTYDLDVATKDGRDFNRAALTEAELENNVGKEMAQKIVDSVSDTNRRARFNNLDLKIGGEGMKAFYDKLVPERVNAVLKRFGGGKIGEVGVRIESGSGNDPLHDYHFDARINQFVVDRVDNAGVTEVGRFDSRQAAAAAVDRLNMETATPRKQPGFDITPAMRERFQKPIPYKKGGLVQAFQFGGTVKSIAAGAKAGAKGAAKAAKPTKAELAHRQAQINAAKPIEEGGLGLRPDNTAEERAAAQGYIDYYHGTERLDRLLEKPGLDPRRATSGPMPYGTTTRELASNYAMSKADTSRRAEDLGQVENYFQVSPKDLGLGFRSPLSVERLWNFLSPEQKQKVMSLAPRVGYENLDDFTGKFTVHPEGVNATLNPSQWDFIMKREAKGNPLAALRHMWYESGQLVDDPSRLAEIYRLAGIDAPISQTNAPWTSAQGVLLGKARVKNPLDTSNVEQVQSLIPKLEEAFKRDRSRTSPQGTDQWDKRSRFTPKQWIDELKKDVEGGKESYVWTSIPDKVTNELKRFGFDSIIDKSGKGGGAKEPVVIPFYPEQVRSRFAAFDPMEQQSPDLLKKKGGLSVLRKKHGN